MLHFERWKIIAIVGTCLAGLLFASPNFFSKEFVSTWPSFLPKRQMPLGLDLRGGAHLLLALDTNDLRKEWLTQLREESRKNLRDAKIGFAAIGIAGDALQIRRRRQHPLLLRLDEWPERRLGHPIEEDV